MSGFKENEKQLFDRVLIVELQEDYTDRKKIVPFISYRYPNTFLEGEDAKDSFSASVTQFCFPDINQFPCEEMNREIFSFVVTDGSGERRFGYCLRKLPPGSGLRFPTAFSILSYFPSYTLYTTIIDKVAYHYENSSMKSLTQFLESMIVHHFPAPGQSFTVKFEEKDFRFSRPDGGDSQLEYVDVDPLLLELNTTNIITIFLSLLFERRIIFCASKLSILSSCVQTAVAFLYPFTWQHIYIPVLPKTLLSFCCAPMPFVVGILASELNEVLTLPMDEVLIVNIDTDSFIRTPGTNDLNILPQNYTEPLKKVVKASTKVVQKYHRKKRELKKLPKSDADFQENQLLYEVKKQKTELKETFLEFFVYLFGSLRKHIHNGVFDSAGFIAAQPAETHEFMELLVGSQMFEIFIQDRIHTKYTDDAFEKSVNHREKLNSEFTRFFGEEVDGSLYKPTASKKVKGSKKGSLMDSFRRGIKTSLYVSNNDNSRDTISSPTLVQSTSDRCIGPAAPSSPSVPSPNLSATGPNNFPTFVPPQKPVPVPPAKKQDNHLSSTVPSPYKLSNSNDSGVQLRERTSQVRHFHSMAVKNTQELPPPPPRKNNSNNNINNFAHIELFESNNNNNNHSFYRGATRGRVARQRPMSTRPGSLGEEEEKISVPSPAYSTLRSSTKNNNRPLPQPPS